MNKRCIIIGSGASIRRGIWNLPIEKLYLWKHLKNEHTIGINWSYLWFTPTVHCYVDYKFYNNEQNGIHSLPLVIAKHDAYYERESISLPENIILLKGAHRKNPKDEYPHYWGKDSLEKGIYSSQLSGMWALNLAIIFGYKEIYLLGMDATDINGYTHFYQDSERAGKIYWENKTYTGVGKNKKGYNTSTYNDTKKLNEVYYKPFEKALDNGIKIYNVSIQSKINIFPKIDYIDFYERTKIKNPINQDIERNKIKELVTPYDCK